ncbi:MAG: hypothetical protein Q9208_007160 [Pyrenodesmia sp. 3 TL-2023]
MATGGVDGIDESMQSFLDSLQTSDLQGRLAEAEVAKVLAGHIKNSAEFFVGSEVYRSQLEHALQEYRHAMIMWFEQDKSQGQLLSLSGLSEANDPLIFPDDSERLLQYARWWVLSFAALVTAVDYFSYLCYCSLMIRPNRPTKKAPSVATILGRRRSLYYWILRKCKNPPVREKFLAATSQAIQYAAKNVGAGLDGQYDQSRPYYGKSELQILIDDDSSNAGRAYEIVEQHHLAWVFGCICGVRPSSLGRHAYDKERFLRWRDIELRREIPEHGPFDGRFTAIVTFRNLKGRNDKVRAPNRYNKLRLTVGSPRLSDNLPFSLPHRLLTIALRRNLLQDCASVEDLFTGRLLNIAIKPEALDQPVFLAPTKGGVGLLPGIPLMADTFTSYMRKVAQRCGLERGTMYAWRRKAATEVARAAGADNARLFLNHGARTTTYEEYYSEEEYDLDVTAIGLGEDYAAGSERLRADSRPSLYRATIPPLGSTEHKAFVKAFFENDSELSLRVAAGDLELAAYRRSLLRAPANEAWAAYHRKLAQGTLTAEQLDARRKELSQPSNLMVQVRKSMQAAPTDVDNEYHDDDGNGLSGDDDDHTDIEKEISQCEDRVVDSDATAAALDSADAPDDEQDVLVDNEKDDTFAAEAKAFMLFSVEKRTEAPNGIRSSDTLQETYECAVCHKDNTVAERQKARKFSRRDLHLHLASEFHSDYRRFCRGAEIRKQPDGLYTCPYADCALSYRKINGLMEHIMDAIERETSKDQDDGHFHAIQAAGWGSPDFSRYKELGKYGKYINSKRHRKPPGRISKRPMADELGAPRSVRVKFPSYEYDVLLGPNVLPDSLQRSRGFEDPSVGASRLLLDEMVEKAQMRAAGWAQDTTRPDGTPFTTLGNLPGGNITKSSWWPSVPYGTSGPREELPQAQRTLIMAAVSQLGETMAEERDRRLLWETEISLLLQSQQELYAFARH